MQFYYVVSHRDIDGVSVGNRNISLKCILIYIFDRMLDTQRKERFIHRGLLIRLANLSGIYSISR